jgi:hypothetical protein
MDYIKIQNDTWQVELTQHSSQQYRTQTSGSVILDN